jgi:hypothetical protein
MSIVSNNFIKLQKYASNNQIKSSIGLISIVEQKLFTVSTVSETDLNTIRKAYEYL